MKEEEMKYNNKDGIDNNKPGMLINWVTLAFSYSLVKDYKSALAALNSVEKLGKETLKKNDTYKKKNKYNESNSSFSSDKDLNQKNKFNNMTYRNKSVIFNKEKNFTKVSDYISNSNKTKKQKKLQDI